MKNLSKTNQLQESDTTGLYLAEIKRDLSDITYKSYTANLARFVEWFTTAQPAEASQQILNYKAHLVEEGLSARTINLHLTTIRGFYRWLLKNRAIDHDPTLGLSNIKTSKERTKSAVSEYDLTLLIDYLNQDTSLHSKRNRAMVLLALSNGLRVNEVCNCNIEDIQERDGNPVLYLLRKGYTDKSCYTILAPRTLKLLKDFIGEKTEGPMFTGRDGRIKKDSISRLVRKIFIECNIKTPQISFHSLRHSFAMKALKSGCDIPAIATAMNHSNISTTSHYLQSFNRAESAPELKIAINF